MGIISRALGLSLPRGPIWVFMGDAANLFAGLAMAIQRAKDKIDSWRAEAFPGTATDTLPDWHHALGIAHDPTLPIERQRAMLAAMLTATGNSTPAGLALQISKEYPGLTVSEPSAQGYEISGQVERVQDARRVGAICAHFAPLHLLPTVLGSTAPTQGNPNPVPINPTSTDIISVNRVARSGVTTSGLARCGKAS